MKTRSKTPLFLMELIIMLLVFSVSAAVCLQVFSGAKKISEESRKLDAAVMQAQNIAECWKASHGNLNETAEMLFVIPDETGFKLYDEENWLHTEVICEDAVINIAVFSGEEEIYSLACEAVMIDG
ncbi:MAG: hypothetical protein IJN89_06020 [Anaerotignum sp.]|nr:hypothetical protein [Anaerotignum sp.]